MNFPHASGRFRWTAFFAATVALFTAGAAFADQKSNLHVRRIFTEGSTRGGFFPVENIEADCRWGLMYLDLTHPAGRGQLALLIQAKSQNLMVQRVDYVRNGDGTCSTTGIHVE